MPLSKQAIREVYRPTGPKPIQLGVPTPNLNTGGSLAFNQQVDLSLPIRGFQIQFRGSVVVGGTPATTGNPPESFMNIISNFTVQGVNSRQQGNLTLWSAPLADIYAISFLTGQQGTGTFYVTSPPGNVSTLQNRPGDPFGTTNTFQGITEAGTFQWRITVTIPVHPFSFNGFGKSPMSTVLFAVRNEEWKDSIQILLNFAGQANGLAGPLAAAATGTTFTFSSFETPGTGTPVIDLYSLPFISGLAMKDTYLPGVLSRVNNPVTTVLQSNGSNVTVVNLQKQPTPRLYIKQGLSTGNEIFTSLSDSIITNAGILLGGNRNIRNNVDLRAHKQNISEEYQVAPIQGYSLLDFVQNGNYDSNFPGQDVGDGASFTLQANVTGTAGAAADVVQEQLLHLPAGSLAQ